MLRRVFSSAVSIFTYPILVAHKFTNIFSPIRKELIIDRADWQFAEQQSVIIGLIAESRYPVARSARNDDELEYGDRWIYFFRRTSHWRD